MELKMITNLEEKLSFKYELMNHEGDVCRYDPDSQEIQKFLRLPFNVNFQNPGKYKDVVAYIRTLGFPEDDPDNDFILVNLDKLLRNYCETKDGFLVPEWVAKDAGLAYINIEIPENTPAEVTSYDVTTGLI